MHRNIRIDKSLRIKIDAGALNAADYFILALADRLAGLFPAATIYTAAQQQGVTVPAVFITIYHASVQGQLGGVLAFEFETEVSYLPSHELAQDERLTAAITMLEMPSELNTDVGIYELKGRSMNTSDGITQMLCRTEARLKAPNADALMQNLIEGVGL